MYIRITFSIELRQRVSRSLRSHANYRPSPQAQKPSKGVLACRDPITPSNTVKYHSSSNTLLSTEQRGGVRNKYIYIYIYTYRTSSNLYTPDSVSLASLARQLWHTHLHTYIYIYTSPARICTPLIVSRSLRSLANYIDTEKYCESVTV